MSKEIKKTSSVSSLLETETVKNRLQDILGKRASTFASSVIQISQSNNMLKNAEPTSIVNAAITSATLNLPLNNNLGYAYIIPFNEKQKDGSYLVKAQFQIGYKGFLQLAQRSGVFKTVNSSEVKQGEIENIDRLTGEITFNWNQDNEARKKLQTIGYIAYFSLTNGFEKSMYMTIEELNKHGKKFSQTFKKGFGLWCDDFDAMAKKTVLKLLLSKYAPLSIDMQQAVLKDQAEIVDVDDENSLNYLDNKKEVQENEEEKRFKDFINNISNEDELQIAKGDKDAEKEPFKSLIKLAGVRIKK